MGRLILTTTAVGVLVALVSWLLPAEAVLAPLWTQVLGWPAVLVGRSDLVQRWIGSGRLDNRVWLRVLLGGALFAAVLVASVHLQWSGSSAWCACLTMTVGLTALLQVGVQLGGQPTLLTGSPEWVVTGTALVASVATTINIALLAAQREASATDLDTVRLSHHQQLLHAATHDALTETLNRAGLQRVFTALTGDAPNRPTGGTPSTSAHRSARPPTPAGERPPPVDPKHEAPPDAASRAAVIFIDLDRFKPVNDEHGHAAGDLLLRLVAQRLRALLRPTDHLARLGGDEFVVILAGADQDTVQAVSARAVSTLQAPFDLGTAVVSISASVGCAVQDDAATPLEALLDEADAAMYRVKNLHRHDGGGASPRS